jgi:hypothetical protein
VFSEVGGSESVSVEGSKEVFMVSANLFCTKVLQNRNWQRSFEQGVGRKNEDMEAIVLVHTSSNAVLVFQVFIYFS